MQKKRLITLRGTGSKVSRSRRAILLETGADLIVPTIMVFALYLLFAGHNQPGGGFIAGLVAGAGLAVRSLAADPDGEPKSLWAAETLMGAGLLVATIAAIAPWFFGGQLLESGSIEWVLPVLGKVKLFSVLAFDIGVFLVVLGLIVTVLNGLGVSTIDRNERGGDDLNDPSEVGAQ